jgi:glyoxylase-like metal-dependent hydrolase (beta-lactamase superfamily II)
MSTHAVTNGRDEAFHSWSDSGPETVAPGVHRIPLPLPSDGLRAVNVYVLEDGDRLVLVDGGWALEVARERLQESLSELGYSVRDIGLVLVTHIHRDHYTQAVAIRREVGATVGLGIDEQSSLAELMAGRTGSRTLHPGRLRRLGAAKLADQIDAMPVERSNTLSYYESPDLWIKPGQVELDTFALEAVHTPGHTRGHLVFHDSGRELLFAGDHVLPQITPSIGFEPDRPAYPLRDYLASLERVLSMPDAKLLPAHGPVGGSAHMRVHELLAHHEQRLADTGDALALGAGLAPEVAAILRWTSRGRDLEELDLFDQMLAVLETAAHLDVLVLRGEAIREEHGEVVVYAPASGATRQP